MSSAYGIGDIRMSIVRTAARACMAGRIAMKVVLISAGLLVQGCSSSNRDSDGGSSWKLWGNDSNGKEQETAARNAPKDTWQQPSSFDNDGPPSGPSYRGGRDPVTGRASNEWPPASPPPTHSASLAPLPAAPAAASAPSPYRGTAPMASVPSARPLPVSAAAPAAASGGTVEVKAGDTLFRIAKANNVTVPALMQANGLQTETIKLGQRLTIPAP